jgi:hypothetical protein
MSVAIDLARTKRSPPVLVAGFKLKNRTLSNLELLTQVAMSCNTQQVFMVGNHGFLE